MLTSVALLALLTLRASDVNTLHGLHGFIRRCPRQIPGLIHGGYIVTTVFSIGTRSTIGTCGTGFTLGTLRTLDADSLYTFHRLIGRSPREHPIFGDSGSIVTTGSTCCTGIAFFTLRSLDVHRTDRRHGFIGGSPTQIPLFVHSRSVITTSRTRSTGITFGTCRTHFAGFTLGTTDVGDVNRIECRHTLIGCFPRDHTFCRDSRCIIPTNRAVRTGRALGTNVTLGTLDVDGFHSGHGLIGSCPGQIARGINRGSVIPAVIALRSLGTASRKRNGIDRRHISLARSKGYVTRFINGRNIVSASFTLRTLRTDVARFTFVTLGTRFTLRTSRTGFTTRANVALGTTVTLQTFLCKDLIIFASHRSDAHDILQHQEAAAGICYNVKFRVLRRGVVFASRSQ